MKAPQIVMICMYAIALTYALVRHGEKNDPISVWRTLASVVMSVLILWWGGFWRGGCP
jgi:hypothetical protein